MTPQQKKIALYVGIGVVAFGYLYYRRQKNITEATALLQYIGTMPSQTNLDTNVQTGIASVSDLEKGATGINFNKFKIAGMSGAYKDPKISKAIDQVIVQLNAAMKGPGTDTPAFYAALGKIGNKNTLALVDKAYKSMFGETLFEAMKGESALNNVYFAAFSDATKNSMYIPLLSDSHWSPALSSYFVKLPLY